MQQMAAKEIGARIAQQRKIAGMTQEQLAELLNVSKRSVQDYEGGVTIPWKHFRLLEGILRKPLVWFLHGDEAATGEPAPAGEEQEPSRANHALDELRRQVEYNAQLLLVLIADRGLEAPTEPGPETEGGTPPPGLPRQEDPDPAPTDGR